MVYYLRTTSYCLRVYGLILLGFGHDSARILCCGTCLIMFNNRVCAKSFEHGAHLRELCSAFCERHRNTLPPVLQGWRVGLMLRDMLARVRSL